ncbi:MAG: hypothetical protein V4629_11530 [Pseudomonadota bacterium]
MWKIPLNEKNRGLIGMAKTKKTHPLVLSYLIPLSIFGFCSLTFSNLAHAEIGEFEPSASAFSLNNSDVSFALRSGKHEGDFKWSIGNDAAGPNVLSELTYDNLDITLQGIEIGFQPKNAFGKSSRWSGEVTILKGVINDGLAQDSDYDGDNKTGEFSRSISSIEDSDLNVNHFTIGWVARRSKNYEAKFIAGYGNLSQTLRKTDSIQVLSIDDRSPTEGPISGLDSLYETDWKGPSLGLSQSLIKNNHRFQLNVEIQSVTYEATADWNLRQDFAHPVSFTHDAEGVGTTLSFNYQWTFYQGWNFLAQLDKQKLRATNGLSTFYFADGTTGFSGFNEAELNTSGISLGVLKVF